MRWTENFMRECGNCITDKFKTKLLKGPCRGLYLVGQALFNPFTKEVSYWVKVGQTTKLQNRISAYRTNNSAIYYIDWIETAQTDHEGYYHKTLAKISIKKHRQEWFQVTEHLFLKIYNNGFLVLDAISDYDPPIPALYSIERNETHDEMIARIIEEKGVVPYAIAMERIAKMKKEGRLKR